MSAPENNEPLAGQSTETLAENSEHYRYMVELNPQVPWVASNEGRLLDFSPRWLELTGLTRQQALTDGWTDVPHPDDLPRMLAHFGRSLSTGEPLDVQHRIRVANGSYRWMRTRAFPRRDSEGRITHWYGFTEDIEAHVRAEEALQASETRYRSIVETAQEGIWMVNADYLTSFVNARMAEMLGYSVREMVGRPVTDFLAEEERPPFEEQRKERQIGMPGHYDCKYRRKDGSDIWVIVSSAALTDADGRFTGAVAMMTDITDRKRLEMEQDRLTVRLRRAMQETHHRVKNNLQVIAAILDIALIDHPDSVPATDVRRITQQVMTLAEIHNLLTHEAEMQEETDTLLSAREVLHRLLHMLEGTAQRYQFKHNVEDIRLTLRQVTALALAVNELVLNAIKHGKTEVAVSLRSEGRTVRLVVEDDGPGLPPAFDPAASANTGLLLVETLTHFDLGGSLTFENRTEGGARISVIVPVLP